MALVNLKTDLKSLKYENAPYITKDINSPKITIGNGNNNLLKRFEDVDRLAKMFGDVPGGRFLQNVGALSKIDTRPQNVIDAVDNGVGKGNFFERLVKSAKSSLVTIGNVIPSILDNARGSGTGFHQTFGYSPEVKSTGGDNLTQGLLLGGIANFFSTSNDSKGFKNRTSYLGGSYSVYSLEGQEIVIASESFPSIFSQLVSNLNNSALSGTRQELWNSNTGLLKDKETLNITTRNTTVIDHISRDGVSRYDLKAFASQNKEKRFQLGNQAIRTSGQRIDYSSAAPIEAIDKINALQISKRGSLEGEKAPKDIIDFMFNVITPESAEHGGFDIFFRAYLDSFNDNFNSSWNTTQYLGRAENFYTYSGFQREISLSFKIAASTKEEMNPLYNKLSYLASTTAPTYSPTGNFMRGTITRLTVGDYIRDMAGFISNVTLAWQQDYSWDIAAPYRGSQIELTGETGRTQLPTILDCTVSFTPIHNFAPNAELTDSSAPKDYLIGNASMLAPKQQVEQS